LKRIQDIKNRELNEWKGRKQCELQQKVDDCISQFGAAHIAACYASCEEDELLCEQREEYDLLAASRGRSAMLQEQRKRDREAEERLLKRRRGQRKTVAVQADLMPSYKSKQMEANNSDKDENSEEELEEEEEGARVTRFTSKPNLHKTNSKTVNYNPRNFTSNSVDSSNHCDSETSSEEIVESELEFDQITNLLKQKCYEFDRPQKTASEVVEISSETSDLEEVEIVQPQPRVSKKQPQVKPVKKSILKKSAPIATSKKKSSPKKKVPLEAAQRVSYLDFANKYTTSYIPKKDLVTHHKPANQQSNAMEEASKICETIKQQQVNSEIMR